MKTLGELILTDYDAARLILEAWARGEELEYVDNGSRWQSSGTSAMFHDTAYRIPPRPHTVDWSQVGKRIVAFETLAQTHYAITADGGLISAEYWPSFRPGTDGGRIERPKEVE